MGFMDRMKSFFSENGDEIISQGVDAYEEKTGRTVDRDKLKSILLNHDRDIVERVVNTMEVYHNGELIQKESVSDIMTRLYSHSLSMSDDESSQAVWELIQAKDLTNPENLGRFLVELYTEQFKHFDERFHVVEALLEAKDQSLISSAQLRFKDYEKAVANGDEAKQQQYLEDVQSYYRDAIMAFEESLKVRIKTVENIVNRPKFLRSLGLSQMDNAIEAVRRGIELLNEVVPTEAQIMQMNNGNGSDIMEQYQRFYEEWIMDNIGMLKDYCKTEDDAFWEQVEKDGFTPLLME